MSDFTYNPSASSARSRKPRVLSAPFGDGYEQRVADGINTAPAIWSLTFVRGDTDASAIETFLEGKNGVTSFTWTPPGGSEIRVLCREWNRSFAGVNHNVITCTFEQVFGE